MFPDNLPEEKRFVSLFVGYFDDSGRKDGPHPIAVVGGFVARPREWLGFNHRWKKILDKYGINAHHQNKWSNHAKPFNDPVEWRDERRHAYLNELIDLIAALDAASVGTAVPEERFDAHFPEGRKVMSPFGYAAQCAFAATAEVGNRMAGGMWMTPSDDMLKLSTDLRRAQELLNAKGLS